MKLLPAFTVLNSLVQKLRRFSNILRNHVIAWLQLLENSVFLLPHHNTTIILYTSPHKTTNNIFTFYPQDNGKLLLSTQQTSKFPPYITTRIFYTSCPHYNKLCQFQATTLQQAMTLPHTSYTFTTQNDNKRLHFHATTLQETITLNTSTKPFYITTHKKLTHY